MGSIRAISKLADDERINRLKVQYPTSKEMQSFLCSSMAIQYIQKNIDFTLPKINHFRWLAKEITILYLKYHRNRNLQENGKYELLEKVNQKFAESSFAYLKETFKDKLFSVLRHYRAGTYYIAVAKYGNSSFWKDKERLSPEDPMAFRITFTGEFRNLEELQNEFTKEIIENLTKIENLDTIKEFKEETLEVLDTMVKDSLNLSKK